MVITTPMIVYRHGDDVPGERIKEILVYERCISQPDRNVENPDNSDLLTQPLHSVRSDRYRRWYTACRAEQTEEEWNRRTRRVAFLSYTSDELI